jgi:hypothetical protein
MYPPTPEQYNALHKIDGFAMCRVGKDGLLHVFLTDAMDQWTEDEIRDVLRLPTESKRVVFHPPDPDPEKIN